MHENDLIRVIQSFERKMDTVTNALFHLLLQGYNIMAILDELTANVEKMKSASQSAITLLKNIKSKLDSCGTDPVKLAELSSTIGTEAQAMADAVVANTPVENPTP